ncbi:MAG: hypothetical protein WBA64_01410, partial [Marinomonas sp.]
MNLLVMQDGEVLLVIEEYFSEGREASFDDTGSILPSTSFASVSDSEIPVDESPVWSAETDTLVTLSEDAEGAPEVLSTTETPVDTTVPQQLRPDENAPVERGAGPEGKIAAGTEGGEAAAGAAGAEGIGLGWYAAALGLGAVGIAAAGGSSSSGGSSDSSSSGSSSSVTISSAAGTFFSTVQIDIYDNAGNELSSEEHDYSTGDYVYTGTYSGPILVEIIDVNGTSTDYTDETTGEEKSLGTSLRAMTSTDGESAQAISVTPLTELATQLAGVTSENRVIDDESVAMNSKVATMFGLGNILDKPAVVTENTSDASADAVQYGQALAILSGADSDGNASAAETIANIANGLLDEEGNVLVDDDGEITLTSEVTNILTQGQEAYNQGPIGRDNAITTDFGFSSIPVLLDSSNDVVGSLNAEDVSAGLTVQVKDLSVDDEVTIGVGEHSDVYTITAENIIDGTASLPIPVTWFQEGDGNYNVVISVGNTSSNVAVKVDTTAPEEPTFELPQNTGESGDTAASITTVEVSLAANVESWEYSLDGGETWVTRTSGTSFELKGNTTYEVGDILVKQFDKVGNPSVVIGNDSAIDVPDVPAPSLSITDSGVSDSDNITNQAAVTVEFDEETDVASWQYSLDGGASWQDGAGTSFDLLANTSYAADSIQVKQVDGAGVETIGVLSGSVQVDTSIASPVSFLATDSGIDSSDGITSDTTYRVNLTNDATSWEYSLDAGETWSEAQLTSINSFELAENTLYAVGDIQTRQTDIAGNTSDAKLNTVAIQTDSVAPAAPTASLQEDTGLDDTDSVTSDATVDVVLSDDAVVWQYSLDGGTTWSASQSADITSFELSEDTSYPAGVLQVRQYDAAGNESVAYTNDGQIITDSIAPAVPAFSITDSGSDDSDNVTNNLAVNVVLAEDAFSWQYSTDAGTTWSDPIPPFVVNFELAANTVYDSGDIQVRQADAAGNVSESVSNIVDITTDTFVASPSMVLEEDSGSDNADGVTNKTTYQVQLADDVASWEYSLDAGETWQVGVDSSFELDENTIYPADSIQTRQTDIAGNTSVATLNSVVIETDNLAPTAPTASLQEDTGLDDTDSVTSDATVDVVLSDDAVIWQYSLDGGTTWSASQSADITSFELSEDTSYPAGTLQVRQYDAAGNESVAYTNDGQIITDSIAPAAPAFSIT